MPLYCTKNHVNPTGSGFCTSCGEVLWLSPGYILASRYRIVQHLGHGGFGRTYLAEDLHRFNERCVLKQFAPQEQATSQLEKARALFEREASALYKLTHPQLPAFREFFTADLGKGASGLFLAQDYIEGKTYSDLQKPLQEADVKTLISQLLPVLTYIHSQGTIHRDISPDNLILRSGDRLPVLIDFGGVKQVVTASMNQNGRVLTKLGKQGYAPEEQLRSGEVSPSSDLYALAVTALVLLTGKEPDELYDSYKGNWRWGKEIKVSGKLEKVLKKMLADKPSDRYSSALDVAKAWKLPTKLPENNISHIVTVNVVGQKSLPKPTNQPQGNTQVIVSPPRFTWLQPVLLKVAGAGLLVFIVVNALPLLSSLKSLVPAITLTKPVTESQVASLVRRRQALKISSRFFNPTVNEAFYQKHPQLNRRSLKPAPEDTNLRTDWYNIANDLLNKLDSLTPAARSKLGSYPINQNRHNLKPEIERQFYQWFPNQRGKKLNPNTYGQIWEAITFDKVNQLERR